MTKQAHGAHHEIERDRKPYIFPLYDRAKKKRTRPYLTSWTQKPYHPVQFPYAFGNKPHLFAAIFERFYTKRKGYPTP